MVICFRNFSDHVVTKKIIPYETPAINMFICKRNRSSGVILSNYMELEEEHAMEVAIQQHQVNSKK